MGLEAAAYPVYLPRPLKNTIMKVLMNGPLQGYLLERRFY